MVNWTSELLGNCKKMGTAATSVKSQSDGKFREAFIGALFALVLLVPKVINLRRNERSWLLFRTVIGTAGAALVVLPLGLWNSYLFAVVGLAMFTTAILLPPAKPDTSAANKARSLGALVVVNGGAYQSGKASAIAAQLFVGTDRIWALDSHFQTLLVIPVAEIAEARAYDTDGCWLVRIRWSEFTAEFSYVGIFAEHLARVAESTVQSVMHPSLLVLPQRRAAGA